jgi:AcrR family transcriptional regulator
MEYIPVIVNIPTGRYVKTIQAWRLQLEVKRPSETKQRIIRTALRIFLEKGYERTSMRAIALGSGVTKGGIYHYFESKEDLFRQALTFITEQMAKWSTCQFKSVRTAEDLVRALFSSIESMKEAFAGIVGQGHGQHPFSFLEVLINAARRDEGVRQEMATIYSRTRENMRSVFLRAQEGGEIRSDIDCDALALEINALLEGVLLLSVLDRSIDLDTVGERLHQNIWKTIKK